MPLSDMEQKLEAMRSRLLGLRQRADPVPDGQGFSLAESIEELQTTFEELEVAEESLRQQNDELAQLNRKLDAERLRYQSLFDLAPDAYLVTDPAGIIREANLAAARVLHVSHPYLVGKPLLVYIDERDRQAFLSDLARLDKVQRIADWSLRLQPRKGDPVPVVVTVAAVLDDRGRTGSLRWMFRDVTRQKQAEAAIQQLNNELECRVAERTAELEAADRAKDELIEREKAARAAAEAASQAKDRFLAMLSHELRTPLTPVLALISGPDFNEGMNPDQAEQVEVIRRNVELEARLIDDLLDLSRVSTGKMQLNPEWTDIHQLIQRVVEICRDDFRDKKMGLTLDLRAADPRLNVDPARMHQVLWNLLKNAVKFTPPGGRIMIRTWEGDHKGTRGKDDKVQGVADAPASQASHLVTLSPGHLVIPPLLVIEVTDTGIGIEPDLLPRLFDAFEQGETGMARRFGGLGLGLAISRALVTAHGGTLTATSAGKDRGATFTIKLPAPRPAPGAPPASPASSASPASPVALRRVLLVEDHPDTAETLARILQARDFHVQIAPNLRTALRLVEAEPFDLVVSDIGLPDGSGLDLMASLRRDHPNIKGIAVSGYGMSDDLFRSRQAGFDVHLTKPVNIRSLVAAIHQLLG